MTKEEFKSIVSHYKGKITENDVCIKIENKNRIKSHYQDGSVHEDKVVQCEISYRKSNGGLWGQEETHRIQGGFASPPPISKEFLESELFRYGFELKESEQLSLFDL